jgi:hypothetical protein
VSKEFKGVLLETRSRYRFLTLARRYAVLAVYPVRSSEEGHSIPLQEPAVDDTVSFEISFDNSKDREGNQFARDLAAAIRRAAPGATVGQKTESETSQDLGAIVTVLVTSAAMTAVATGIQNWLSQRTKSRLSISRHGVVLAENIDSADAVKIVEIVSKSKG